VNKTGIKIESCSSNPTDLPKSVKNKTKSLSQRRDKPYNTNPSQPSKTPKQGKGAHLKSNPWQIAGTKSALKDRALEPNQVLAATPHPRNPLLRFPVLPHLVVGLVAGGLSRPPLVPPLALLPMREDLYL